LINIKISKANNFTYQKARFYTPSLCKDSRRLLHASLLSLDFDTEKQYPLLTLQEHYKNIITRSLAQRQN